MKIHGAIHYIFLLSLSIFSLSACEKDKADKPENEVVQIQIEQSDIPLIVNINHTVTNAVNIEKLAIPTIGENQVWDYSDMIVSVNSTYNFRTSVPTSPDFEGADLLYSGKTHAIALEVPSMEYQKIDGQQILKLGKVLEGKVYEQFDAKFDIPDQVVTYVPTPIELKFPLTFGQKYASEYTYTCEGYLSSSLSTDDLVQEVITFWDESEVVGWGKLKFRKLEFDVLLLTKVVRTRSHYLINGEDAPDSYLSLWGFAQDSETLTTYYRFYAKGYSAPVLSIGTCKEPSPYVLNAFVSTNLDGDPADFFKQVKK